MNHSTPDQPGTVRPAGAPSPSPVANAPALDGRQRFLEACRCRRTDRPPLWLMRQAGRALPEYRALKEKHSFLDLVRTPELATEVTLQPIRRFGFDAAILFSDILVIAEALGQGYRFRDGGGIQMESKVRTAEDIERLDVAAVTERLAYVPQALQLIKTALGGRTALLGFAGSPWTIANFMLEGGSAHEFTQARLMAYAEPELFARLAEKLTRAITRYLEMQVEAGVDAIQIFDTLGGLLPASRFESASGRWIKQIVAGLNGRVPVIVFAKGVNGSWDRLAETGASVLGVDSSVSLAGVRRALPAAVAVQGNLDPFVLNTCPEVVRAEALRILEEMRGCNGHIFNLGHGVPPTARLENIETLVNTVVGFRSA